MKRIIYFLFYLLLIKNSLAQNKPNVLMIVLDDLNDYIGVLGGHPQSHTPNIDKLAKQGVLFSNAHASVPVCSPSRASFMNGVSPITSGYWGFGNWMDNEILMNTKSIPEYVRENGYVAFQTGKVFHSSKPKVWTEMGAVPDYGPLAYNGKNTTIHPSNPKAMAILGPLDATFTSLADVPNIPASKDTPGYNGWYNIHWKNKGPFHYRSETDRDSLTDEKSAQYAINKIKQLESQKQKTPFFMAVGFIRPHTPLVVPQKYYDMFPLESVQIPLYSEDDISDTKLAENSSKEPRGRVAYRTLTTSYTSKEKALQLYIRSYLASVAFADAMVGKTLKALEESSFNKNTIVVLFGDHGYNMGEKQYLFKYCLWEKTTRTPLIIKIPNNHENAGKEVKHAVSLLDIYPTLKDLCNLKGKTTLNKKGADLDGFSLKPFLENPHTEKWKGPKSALTIISSWKSKKPENQHITIKTKRYRYIHYANGSDELYDHKTDPNEWNNLVSLPKHAELRKRLKTDLFNHISNLK